LRERRYLIDDCWMAWTRNPNYLGEITLYTAFNVIAQCEHMWYIYPFIWLGIMNTRMTIKDYQLSKKQGWEEYKNRTWMFLPKLYDNSLTTFIFYLLCTSTAYATF